MKILSQGARDALANLDIKATNGAYHVTIRNKLDRKIYTEVNTALEEIGGKWNRSAKAHVFGVYPSIAIDAMLDSGAYVSKKQDFGFFETPVPLAQQLVQAADIRPGMRVLEPSAGRGNLVRAIFEAQPTAHIWAVEQNVEIYAELYNKLSTLCDANIITACADYLAWQGLLDFDRVVMNPPFAKLADVHHVMRAFSMLKPSGKLAAIMSASWTFNRAAETFRQFVDEHGKWEKLPDASFAEAGTGVSTTMVTLQKD